MVEIGDEVSRSIIRVANLVINNEKELLTGEKIR